MSQSANFKLLHDAIVSTNNSPDALKTLLHRDDAKTLLTDEKYLGRTLLNHACYNCRHVTNEIFELLLSEIKRIGGDDHDSSFLKERLTETGEDGWSNLMHLYRYCPSSRSKSLQLVIDMMTSFGMDFFKEQLSVEVVQTTGGSHGKNVRSINNCLSAASSNPLLDKSSLRFLLCALFENDLFKKQYLELTEESKLKLEKHHDDPSDPVDVHWHPRNRDAHRIIAAVNKNDRNELKKILQECGGDDDAAKKLFDISFPARYGNTILLDVCNHQYVSHEILGFLLDEIHRVGGDDFFRDQVLRKKGNSNMSCLANLCYDSSSDAPAEIFLVKLLQFCDRSTLKEALGFHEYNPRFNAHRCLIKHCCHNQRITAELRARLITFVVSWDIVTCTNHGLTTASTIQATKYSKK